MNKISIKKVIIIIAVILIAIFLAFLLIYFNRKEEPLLQEKAAIELIIPWNEGGAVDSTLREVINNLNFTDYEAELFVTNLQGENGAVGINTVYERQNDGKTVLGTNLYSFLTAEYMGFTDYSYENWDIWFTAFSPSCVAVSKDSPFNDLDDLIEFGKENELICGNSGNSTLSFVSAYIFSENNKLNVKHTSFAGLNPTVNALISGEIDFIMPLYTEVHDKVESGEIRVLANVDEIGEYFALMIPSANDNAMKNAFSSSLEFVLKSEKYLNYMHDNGLESLQIDGNDAQVLAEKMKKTAIGALYSSGTFSKKP